MSSNGGEIGFDSHKRNTTARNQSDVRSQVSSALTRGYLYAAAAAAAAASISIFGSLGVVTAGFKKLVGCFSFGDIEGAKILGIWDSNRKEKTVRWFWLRGKRKNTGQYTIETRMDKLIKEPSIDKSRITGVSLKSTAWMIATTELLYYSIYLGANDLKKSTTWVFPDLCATGGFITATFISYDSEVAVQWRNIK